ncbi:hypothetical protein ABW19_dt0209637 [Dactylella cylindrospora]|nr:hypothetical protein ABW19_dt0209637 [Dactylella cylindrospora]
MDPRLAQILQTLSETTSGLPLPASASTIPPVQPGLFAHPSGQPFQLTPQLYDPRRIFQTDSPQPIVPAQHAKPPVPSAGPVAPALTTQELAPEKVDPKSITQWPAALKYITSVVTKNEVVMNRLKKMKMHQQEHERLWWKNREEIVKRHSNSANSRLAMASVLKTFGATSTASETTPEQQQSELKTYDEKVYRASQQMYKSMAEDLKVLQIPFFVITEEEFPGDKQAFADIRKKVVELLDDLT